MPTEAENAAQRKSLSQVRVWVFMIWAGVFLSAMAGIMNRSGTIYSADEPVGTTYSTIVGQ
jgi:hypothetical protein